MWLNLALFSRTTLFKGSALVLLGIFALLFAYYMKKKWNEHNSFGFFLFVGVACFIILFGLYILVISPNWWALPY